MRKTNINNHLKSYFTFSKAEKNGIVILLVILTILIIASVFLPGIYENKAIPDYTDLQKEVDSLFVKTEAAGQHQIRFLSDSVRKKPVKPQNVLLVNLNSCDSSELIKLPGVGPVLASRIIKYRKILGGYYHKAQLLEVYGLKEENYKKAADHILIDKSEIKGISIDTSAFRTLLRHPYIGKEMAWKIIDFRKKHQDANISLEEFLNAQIFDSAQWSRVKHYLIFTKK